MAYMDQGLAILQPTSSSLLMMTERSGRVRHERFIASRSESLGKSDEMDGAFRSGNLDTLVAHFAAIAYLLPEMSERPG